MMQYPRHRCRTQGTDRAADNETSQKRENIGRRPVFSGWWQAERSAEKLRRSGSTQRHENVGILARDGIAGGNCNLSKLSGFKPSTSCSCGSATSQVRNVASAQRRNARAHGGAFICQGAGWLSARTSAAQVREAPKSQVGCGSAVDSGSKCSWTDDGTSNSTRAQSSTLVHGNGQADSVPQPARAIGCSNCQAKGEDLPRWSRWSATTATSSLGSAMTLWWQWSL